MNLSKSQYIRGTQCKKSLWLLKHKPELREKPTQAQQTLFDSGRKLEYYARDLFNCTHIIEFHQGNFDDKMRKTTELVASGVSSIAEATFIYNGIVTMVDILESTSQGVIINEIKSGTSLNEVYVRDVALQYYVLHNLGFNIIGANVCHIDSSYERGDELEIDKLFSKVSVLEQVQAMQEQVALDLAEFEQCIKGDEPHIDIGDHCANPYPCDFRDVCWSHIPQTKTIFNLSRLRDKFSFYKNGVLLLDDISDMSSFSTKQVIQIKATQKQQPHIDTQGIKKFLQSLRYPIYHLDFETFMEAIPSFARQRPYMQIPFQYSLHIQHEDGRLEHREFLAEAVGDPRKKLAEALIADIPEGAFLLAYNAVFERGVLQNLSRLFPEFKARLQSYCKNLYDLMEPFSNFHYYHHEQNGSYSIKKVLPVLDPTMADAYKSLSLIHNGEEAMSAFPNLKYMDSTTQQRTREALLAYCKLDTLAMVKVLEKLKDIVGG